jgi:1-deoxy-D-xylulose-5-phosphate synthase
VVFAIDRAGLVGSDGETHQGIFDLSYLAGIPNLCIMAPKNKQELYAMLKFALKYDGPIAIRYPRGAAYEGLEGFREKIAYGKAEVLYKEREIALLAVGSMVKVAEEVRETLKERGWNCTLVNARFVKEFDKELIRELSEDHKLLVTMEENVTTRGFGERVVDYVATNHIDLEVEKIALPDMYVEHGNVNILYKDAKIDAESVVERIVAAMEDC